MKRKDIPFKILPAKRLSNLALACLVGVGFALQIRAKAYASETKPQDEIKVFYSEDSVNQNFIKMLGDHFCSGCGKHCPLIAPLCLIGEKNQRSALLSYEDIHDLSASDRNIPIDGRRNAMMNIVEITDDSMDYVMVLGLITGGIYYTSSQIKTAKRKQTHEK